MLVLKRKKEESIVIGQNIVVKIVSVEDGTVKLGIEAPGHIGVYRQEVYEKIRQTNKEALMNDQPFEYTALSNLLKKHN